MASDIRFNFVDVMKVDFGESLGLTVAKRVEQGSVIPKDRHPSDLSYLFQLNDMVCVFDSLLNMSMALGAWFPKAIIAGDSY